MVRTNLLLLALLVACAIGAIASQHHARQAFIALESEQVGAQKLQEEYTQLQLEQGTWGTHKRVEAIASKSLGMKLPDAASTVVVTLASSVDAEKAPKPEARK